MSLDTRQRYYLQKMGIDIYVSRDSVDTITTQVTRPGSQADIHTAERMKDDLDKLRAEVAACTKCELHKGRTQTVFGTGDIKADWMIIGEAPGAEEDKQGEPFVGRAGKLLNSMLRAIGLKREEVYIANIIKCRPPNNRDPRPEEVTCCENYLKQQIAMTKPKIILAVGRIAAQNLLKIDTPIGQMRGRRYEYPGAGIPVVVTYHPAYLLRSPREKRKSWQDLKYAIQVYRELQ
jgi:uracil-DNA glycosylase, family 4